MLKQLILSNVANELEMGSFGYLWLTSQLIAFLKIKKRNPVHSLAQKFYLFVAALDKYICVMKLL